MIFQYIAKAPPQFFAALVGSGLAAVMLVFLAVQSMPVFGWLLWLLSLVAVLAVASSWYRAEFSTSRRADEDNRLTAQQKTAENNRTELRRQRASRRGGLMVKYADDRNLVERIVQGSCWDGQTATQLKDALGNPGDIAARMQRGRRVEIWKYHPTGGDRYALWITLEQDRVVQWEQRA